MTDQIPAGLTRDEARAVREWAERARDAQVQDATVFHAARVLLAVLPKRPTLADMTYEGRKECQWMQADSKPTGSHVVILEPNWTVGSARVLRETGRAIEARADALTPRPDLPRLTWPGGDQEADQ